MLMGRKYKKPPIAEAICEFRLTPETPWDFTVPGLFYDKVQDAFPHREQRVVQEVELTQEPQGLRQQIRTSERVLLFAKDRKMLVQLGSRLLVINALQPYPTWEGFKPKLVMAWNELRQVVDVRGLERIGLRYINRIELSEKEASKLRDYFEFYPFISARLPQHLETFVVGAEFPYKGGRDRCRVQLSPAQQGALILDIDYFLARPNEVPFSEVFEWVEEAHSQVEEVFESCITDHLRSQFEEIR